MGNEPLLGEENDMNNLSAEERRESRRLAFSEERNKAGQDSIETRQRIDHFVKSARPIGSGGDTSYEANLSELEKSLRELEKSLFEREQAVQEREVHLTERERTIFESEALLQAREDILRAREKRAASSKPGASGATVDPEERKALERLRDEVAKQQESLEEQKLELKEREKFVEESENTLFEKTMEQQEEEGRLEQMREDLKARELRVNASEGKPPPPEEPKEVL